jgi:hypothetical protein
VYLIAKLRRLTEKWRDSQVSRLAIRSRWLIGRMLRMALVNRDQPLAEVGRHVWMATCRVAGVWAKRARMMIAILLTRAEDAS